jgi:hypothetical protein
MTSKERVHLALQRKPTDRIPTFMWYHPQTRHRLGKLLEIPAEYVPVVMGDDIRQTWVSNNYAMEGIVHQNDGESHVDDWAIEWTRIDGFNQISKYPLADATAEELLQYEFPYNRIIPLVNLMRPVMAFENDYFVGCDVSPCVFEMYCNSQMYWDRLLMKSRAVLGVATDDSHRPGEDSGGGWVMVKAKALTAEDIVKAMRNGQFYFSGRPILEEVYLDTESNVYVRCSPVTVIRALSTVGKAVRVTARSGEMLTEADDEMF